MEFQEIYATCLGSIFVVFIGFQLTAVLAVWRSQITAALRKYISQSVVVMRRDGSTDVTVAAALGLLVLAAGNVTGCIVGVATQPQLVNRLGVMTTINLIPLYFGGRTGFFISRVCGLSIITYGALHRWLGWICLLEGAAHIALAIQLSDLYDLSWNVDKGIMCAAMLVIALLSFYRIRRTWYELFLKTHLLSILSLNIALWFHLTLSINTAALSLSIASLFWIIQTVIWACCLLYRNSGNSGRVDHHIYSFHRERAVDALYLTIGLHRPWKVKPGQYVYVTLPSRHRGGIQAHPYLIVWSEEDSSGRSTSISLLIECRSGFSRQLLHKEHPRSALLDGPYGATVDLDNFDKVVLIASGIGIAAHVLMLRHLINAHNIKTARVRRLSLYWILNTASEYIWLSEAIKDLAKSDENRRIFVGNFYVVDGTAIDHALLPSITSIKDKSSSDEPSDPVGPPSASRFQAGNRAVDYAELVSGEWGAEAGNMAISLCASPLIEQQVRRAVRRDPHDIYIVTSPFQMDGSSENARPSGERPVPHRSAEVV